MARLRVLRNRLASLRSSENLDQASIREIRKVSHEILGLRALSYMGFNAIIGDFVMRILGAETSRGKEREYETMFSALSLESLDAVEEMRAHVLADIGSDVGPAFWEILQPSVEAWAPKFSIDPFFFTDLHRTYGYARGKRFDTRRSLRRFLGLRAGGADVGRVMEPEIPRTASKGLARALQTWLRHWTFQIEGGTRTQLPVHMPGLYGGYILHSMDANSSRPDHVENEGREFRPRTVEWENRIVPPYAPNCTCFTSEIWNDIY